MTDLASTRFKFRISDLSYRLPHGIPFACRPEQVYVLFYQYCLLAMLLAALCQLSLAGASDPLRYQTGLRNSPSERRLNSKYLEKLLNSLREKTGFLEMHFDETGFLRLGDRMKIAGGSAAARELLIAAVDRARVIELECHDRSIEVAFARLAKPIAYISYLTGARIDAYPIQIDFSDFSHLRGDKSVLAAFDLGFVVLHELAHAALGLHDSVDENAGPGECEEYINRIRNELGLPERQNYIARTFTTRYFPMEKASYRAELLFALKGDQQERGKTQIFNLSWEAERVGVVKQSDFKLPSVASKVPTSSAKVQTMSAP